MYFAEISTGSQASVLCSVRVCFVLDATDGHSQPSTRRGGCSPVAVVMRLCLVHGVAATCFVKVRLRPVDQCSDSVNPVNHPNQKSRCGWCRVRDTDVTVAHAEVGPECRAERMLALPKLWAPTSCPPGINWTLIKTRKLTDCMTDFLVCFFQGGAPSELVDRLESQHIASVVETSRPRYRCNHVRMV